MSQLAEALDQVQHLNVASLEPHPEPARVTAVASFPPQYQRTALVIGGFPHDSERDVICERLREIFQHEPGVRAWWTPGKLGSVGKVNFSHERSRVDVPEKVQGNQVNSRVQAALTHLGSSAGRSPALQERVSLAIKVLRTRAVERSMLTHGAEMGINGDRERGRVWFKKLRMEERAVTVRLPPPTQHIHRVRNCPRMERGLHGFVEGSHGEGESSRIGETSGTTVCVLSSGFVECGINPGGAAADKEWSCVKSKPKCLHNFCDLGKTIIGRCYACKNSPRRMEVSSLRQLRVTGCVQRLHARGNDVWRLWSQRRLFHF